MIPAGGPALDGSHCVRPRYAFFLPVKVLSRVFRGKFIAGLKRAFRDGKLSFPEGLRHLAEEKAFRSFLRPLFRHDWVVYAKPPFGGPQHVLHYLARYTHRVAISNHRITNVADGQVTFRWKDYARGSKQRTMAVSSEEFLPASCCTSRRAASCASASSDSWPTGGESNPCPSAKGCWRPSRLLAPQPFPRERPSYPLPGCVRAAVASWSWSKGSRQKRSAGNS